MSEDLKSIGLAFDRWQDAVEAAIATDRLAVSGVVRGGQLIQYSDLSGAQINILAVEPYATWAGFDAETQVNADIDMVNDVLALVEIKDPAGAEITTVTANLAQGPLFAEVGPQPTQPIGLTALTVDATVYPSDIEFEQATGEVFGMVYSEGAQLVASGSGAAVPDAGAQFSARVVSAERRRSELTGQSFIHAVVDGPFAFDVCLPDSEDVPARGAVIAGTALLSASVKVASGGGCGGGGCGCGGCGCGGH